MHVHSGYSGGPSGPQVRQHQNPNIGGGQNTSYGAPSQAHLNPVSAPNSSSSNRTRANTISQMDTIPPALARLQHMNQDVISGRNALTPVLNRDDAMREWERRQQGGRAAQVPAYPQLEYLQQQAEMAVIGGHAWANTIPPVATGGHPLVQLNHAGHRYNPPQPSKLPHSYHPPPQTPTSATAGPAPAILVDDEAGSSSATVRRDAILSNVRSAARGDVGPQQTPSGSIYGAGGQMQLSSSMNVSSPSGTYSGPMMNRYTATYGGSSAQPQSAQQNQQSNSSAGGSGGVFDSMDRRSDLGSIFVPMQPDNYHQPPPSQPQQQQQPQQSLQPHGGPGSGARGHVISPQQIVPSSFYATGIVPNVVPLSSASQVPVQGQSGAGGGSTVLRNPFTSMPVSDPSVVNLGGKPQDVRRGSGMDVWPR